MGEGEGGQLNIQIQKKTLPTKPSFSFLALSLSFSALCFFTQQLCTDYSQNNSPAKLARRLEVLLCY